MASTVSVIVLFILVSFSASPVAEAQQPKVYRIGVLSLVSTPAHEAPVFSGATHNQLFLRTLEQLGYTEDENLVIERRFAGGEMSQLPELAMELVRLQPDLILVESTPATFAAQKATSTIPVVFTLAASPVRNGFVASLSRPGGNLTGYYWSLGYAFKWAELLKELVPGLTRVARMCPTEEIKRCRNPGLDDAATKIGLEMEVMEVNGPENFDRFYAAAESAGVGAVLITPMASTASWKCCSSSASGQIRPVSSPT